MEFLVFLAGLLASAYFAGMETGVYSVSRVRLQARLARGSRSAGIVARLFADPQALVATLLVGTNLGTYAATAVFTGWFAALRLAHAEIWAALVLAPFVFVFAELLPKDILRKRADQLFYRLAPSLQAVSVFLSPLAYPITLLARLVGRGVAEQSNEVFLTRPSLRWLIREGEEGGSLSPTQARMAHNVMALHGVDVRRFMIPLEKVVRVGEEARVEDVVALSRARHFSQLPVQRAGGEIVGVVSLYDLARREVSPASVREAIREAPRFDPATPVVEALRRLQEGAHQMGIVEKGRVPQGVVTVKDLLRGIVGKVES